MEALSANALAVAGVGLEPYAAAPALHGLGVQGGDVPEPGQQALRRLLAGLDGQLNGGGAGKEPLEVLRRVAGDELALRDYEYGLSDRLHLGEDVAAEYDRVLAAQGFNEVAYLDYLDGVEADGGLVEDDDLRVAEQGLGYAHALAVAL